MGTKLIPPHAVLIEPLATEDGGGYWATVPELPGCHAAGETPEEALANILDEIPPWIEAADVCGVAVTSPQPTHRAG